MHIQKLITPSYPQSEIALYAYWAQYHEVYLKAQPENNKQTFFKKTFNNEIVLSCQCRVSQLPK